LLSILIEYEIQNRKGFEVVKERITSAIFIRLTGLPEGYKFIEQKYPEWLETEYEKWVKPESSQMYFSNLEQLLNNCLNFSHRKSGGYKI
jgi:sulfatase maturation enzyme AslB (radical SAM superfamily)